jgi:hypothetical protein
MTFIERHFVRGYLGYFFASYAIKEIIYGTVRIRLHHLPSRHELLVYLVGAGVVLCL